MPKVPIISPEVTALVAPQVSAPPMMRPPADAFGGDVAQAGERLGAVVSNIGDVISQRVMEHQQRENEQHILDVQTQFQKDLQGRLINQETDKDGVPTGFLSRNLNQAKGSTIQFDQTAADLHGRYIGMARSPQEREAMNKILSAHLTSAREQVISHEARQTEAAFAASYKANREMTVSSAAGIADPQALSQLIKSSTETLNNAWQHMGVTPEQIANEKQSLAGDMVTSSITALIENNPKAAQKILDENKGMMSALDVAKLQNILDGKELYDQKSDAWNAVSGMRLATGEVDLASAHKYVEKLPYPQERKDQILSYVQSRATIDEAEMKQRQEAAKTNYVNQLVTNLHKDSIDVAHAKAVMTGLPPAMIAELQKKADDLYKTPQLRFETWKNSQPQATIAAIDAMTLKVKGFYPSKTKTTKIGGEKVTLQQAALNELENQWIGKTPAQIRQITADALKDVVTDKGWLWDTEEISWKVSAANRNAEDLRMGQLEKDNPEAFARAKARVIKDGAPVVYDNIKAAMAKIGGAK